MSGKPKRPAARAPNSVAVRPGGLRQAWRAQIVPLVGTGVGNLTLEVFCAEQGLAVELATTRMAAAGLTVDDDENLKQAATRQGVSPLDLLKAALVAPPP